MTTGLLKSSKTLDRLYKNALNKSKTDIIYEKYKRYRNMFNKLKRNSKQQYYYNIFNDYKMI